MKVKMWENYKHIRFIATAPPPDWPAFAIITAWNPRSQWLARAENDHRHHSLLARLSDYPYFPLWGSSPDRQWQELSLAVACPLATAGALAREFGQNAIYWVERGELLLVPILLAQDGATLGPLDAYWIAQCSSLVK